MSRKSILSLALFLSSSALLLAQPNYSWVLNGNQAGDFAEISDVAVDANGSSYVLLNYTEPINSIPHMPNIKKNHGRCNLCNMLELGLI